MVDIAELSEYFIVRSNSCQGRLVAPPRLLVRARFQRDLVKLIRDNLIVY